MRCCALPRFEVHIASLNLLSVSCDAGNEQARSGMTLHGTPSSPHAAVQDTSEPGKLKLVSSYPYAAGYSPRAGAVRGSGSMGQPGCGIHVSKRSLLTQQGHDDPVCSGCRFTVHHGNVPTALPLGVVEGVSCHAFSHAKLCLSFRTWGPLFIHQ